MWDSDCDSSDEQGQDMAKSMVVAQIYAILNFALVTALMRELWSETSVKLHSIIDFFSEAS